MSEGLVHPLQRDGEDGVNLFWGTVRSRSPGDMRSGIWKSLPAAAPVLSNGTRSSQPWDIWADQLAGGLVPRLHLWNPLPPDPHHTPSLLSGWHIWAPLLSSLSVLKCVPESAHQTNGAPFLDAVQVWFFHTETTFVFNHMLNLLSGSGMFSSVLEEAARVC